jgi:hypothetical protein
MHMNNRAIGSLALAVSVLGVDLQAQVSPARPRADAQITSYSGTGTVSRIPDSIRKHFKLDTTFYAKFADASGIPVMSSALVPDEALLVTRDVITHMLSRRPDLRQDIIEHHGRVGVMAVTEMTTDIPEQRDWKKPSPSDRRLTDFERAQYEQPGGIGSMTDREYWNRRARGMGGSYVTCAEENVLGYPNTRYYGENILVHEFSHSIHGAMRRVNPALQKELEAAYEEATKRKMYVNARGSRHYAVNTISEYWAEGTQWWFWNNYPEKFVTDGIEYSVWSPDELRLYDPRLYAILAKVYPDHHIPMDVYHGKMLRNAPTPIARPAADSLVVFSPDEKP